MALVAAAAAQLTSWSKQHRLYKNLQLLIRWCKEVKKKKKKEMKFTRPPLLFSLSLKQQQWSARKRDPYQYHVQTFTTAIK